MRGSCKGRRSENLFDSDMVVTPAQNTEGYEDAEGR